MKTATKILLVTYVILIIAVISLLVVVRQGIASGELVMGEGEIVKIEKKKYDSFDRLELRNNIHVYITQDTLNQVMIEAHENIVHLVETEFKEGGLHISLTDNVARKYTPKVHISVVELMGIDAARGIRVESVNTLKGSSLSQTLQAGARSELMLDYEDLKIKMRAGAFTKLSGNVDKLFINSSAGALFEGIGLTARTCEINARMGTVNTLNVSDKITGNVSQGSVLAYAADPDITELSFSSGGQVNRINDR